MKKKIVIEVQMYCDKCRKKAMQLTASSDGVSSVALGGDSKSQLTVIGDDVDSTKLVNILRKKVGRAKIVQLGDVEEKKEKKEEKKEITTISHWYPPCNYGPPIMFYECSTPSPCSIQ